MCRTEITNHNWWATNGAEQQLRMSKVWPVTKWHNSLSNIHHHVAAVMSWKQTPSSRHFSDCYVKQSWIPSPACVYGLLWTPKIVVGAMSVLKILWWFYFNGHKGLGLEVFPVIKCFVWALSTDQSTHIYSRRYKSCKKRPRQSPMTQVTTSKRHGHSEYHTIEFAFSETRHLQQDLWRSAPNGKPRLWASLHAWWLLLSFFGHVKPKKRKSTMFWNRLVLSQIKRLLEVSLRTCSSCHRGNVTFSSIASNVCARLFLPPVVSCNKN